jgi:phage FluMu protein Com
LNRNKQIRCANCGKIIAEGFITDGEIEIDCRCGAVNKIEIRRKEKKNTEEALRLMSEQIVQRAREHGITEIKSA